MEVGGWAMASAGRRRCGLEEELGGLITLLPVSQLGWGEPPGRYDTDEELSKKR